MTAPAAPLTRLDHLALFYREAAELTSRLVDVVEAAEAEGHAVVVSLDEEKNRRLAGALGRSSADVTFMAAGERYARPAGAMAEIVRYTRDRLDRGASGVVSVGELAFDGSEADLDWVRYEAAVNDVLAPFPLRGVCLFDEAALPSTALSSAHRTHPSVERGGVRTRSSRYADPHELCHGLGLGAQTPARHPDLDLPAISDMAGLRAQVTQGLEAEVDAARMADIVLVAVELATNSLRHAERPADVRIWVDEAEIVVQAADDGPGLSDPYPELRAVEPLSPGGLGLFLVGQLSSRVHVGSEAGHTLVTAHLDRTTPPVLGSPPAGGGGAPR